MTSNSLKRPLNAFIANRILIGKKPKLHSQTPTLPQSIVVVGDNKQKNSNVPQVEIEQKQQQAKTSLPNGIIEQITNLDVANEHLQVSSIPSKLLTPPSCDTLISKSSGDDIGSYGAYPNSNSEFKVITQYVLWEEGHERFVITLGSVRGAMYLGLSKFWRWENENFKPTRHNIYLPLDVWEKFYMMCMESVVQAELHKTSVRTYTMERKKFNHVVYVGVRCVEDGTFRKSVYLKLQVLHYFMCHIWLLSKYVSPIKILRLWLFSHHNNVPYWENEFN